MTEQVVILGAGGFAREVLDVISAARGAGHAIDCRGFLVDPDFQSESELLDRPVLGGLDLIPQLADTSRFVCGVGAPEIRYRMVERAVRLGARFSTLIHPAASMSRWVELGLGVIVTAGVRLTNRIRIGDHVHLNLNCTVGHDANLHDFVTASPGVHISGGVEIGQGTFLGTGAVVLEKLSIGHWARVGAGSVVNSAVPHNSTAVGVPARVVKQRPEGWQL